MSVDLHHRAVVADTHNDLLMAVTARPPERWASYFRERWLPQLREGGVNLQVLPVFIDDEYRPEGALRADAAHDRVCAHAGRGQRRRGTALHRRSADRRGARRGADRPGAGAGECAGPGCERGVAAHLAPAGGAGRLDRALGPYRAGRRQRRGRHRQPAHRRRRARRCGRWNASA